MLINDFFKGTCKVKLKCKNIKKIINSLRAQVSLAKLTYIDEYTISFVCFSKEIEIVTEKVNKMSGEILFIKHRGLPVILSFLKKRPGLVAGMLLLVFLTISSTFFVWQIRVEGNEKLSERAISEMLLKAGLYEGIPKRQVNVRSIVNKVLINEDELSWLSINLDGTVAHVEIKEAKIGKSHDKKENVNLVASHNGIIMRVDALEGQSKVASGDAVEKGSLLISAFVDKRTGGSLLRGARGYVWAKTDREYKVFVPLEYVEKEYSEKNSNSYRVSFLGKNITFSLPDFEKSKAYERKYHTYDTTVYEGRRLPFIVVNIKRIYYTPKVKKRTESEALDMAREIAKERLKLDSPTFTTVSVVENHTQDEKIFLYSCIFEGIENIAEKKEFELS